MTNLVDLESDKHFDQLRNDNTVLIFDCWANWCGPCKKIAPEFKKLSEKFAHNQHIKFVKHNVDNDFPQIPHSNDIEYIPTFFVYSKDTKRYRKFKANEFNNMKNLISLIDQKLLQK
tara:strand:+ start:4105 stop:4455 length:351 start_codon:yes stop_codon:yes gene_type:complete